eukprot:2056275-Pleurochrysis_carterae.AAC.1
MERWWERYISTRRAASKSSGVGQLIARHSIPTAKATSGRIWVEQYSSAPTRDLYEDSTSGDMERVCLLARASSTSWVEIQMQACAFFGRKVALHPANTSPLGAKCNFSCLRVTQDSSTEMSTFRKSDTGPSSSTFQLSVSACTNSSYKEPAPS